MSKKVDRISDLLLANVRKGQSRDAAQDNAVAEHDRQVRAQFEAEQRRSR